MMKDERPTQIPMGIITGPVMVPLLQALVTGIGSGLFALAVALWAKVDWWLPVWFLVTVGGFLYSWLSYRGRWQYIIERVLEIERAMNVDINQDGWIGPPEPPRTIRVEVVQNNGHQTDYIDLPYPDKQPLLAQGLLAGEPFSMRRWAVETDLFSQGEFRAVQDEFIKRRLAVWKNDDHRQGAVLTNIGKIVCQRVIEDYTQTALPHWPELPGD